MRLTTGISLLTVLSVLGGVLAGDFARASDRSEKKQAVVIFAANGAATVVAKEVLGEHCQFQYMTKLLTYEQRLRQYKETDSKDESSVWQVWQWSGVEGVGTQVLVPLCLVSQWEEPGDYEDLIESVGRFMVGDPWGRHYMSVGKDGGFEFDEARILAITDANRSGIPEVWMSYRTMFGQYGLVVLEERDGTFERIAEVCPRCGD